MTYKHIHTADNYQLAIDIMPTNEMDRKLAKLSHKILFSIASNNPDDTLTLEAAEKIVFDIFFLPKHIKELPTSANAHLLTEEAQVNLQQTKNGIIGKYQVNLKAGQINVLNTFSLNCKVRNKAGEIIVINDKIDDIIGCIPGADVEAVPTRIQSHKSAKNAFSYTKPINSNNNTGRNSI